MNRKKPYRFLIALIALVLLNVVAHCFIARYDMTDDKRYSLSPATIALIDSLDAPIHVTLFLDGSLNASFQRLQQATKEILDDMGATTRRRNISYQTYAFSDDSDSQLQAMGLQPIVVHERAKEGKTVQQTVYPYAIVAYKDKKAIVSLLQNNRGMSGEQNLNASIENLEYAFAQAIHRVQQQSVPRIAFIEGHGELNEENVYDISLALSRYFQIDRGQLGNDPRALDGYKAIIIADAQIPFSESDKYIIDQYIQRGGNVLWVLNGVRLSQEVLAESGFTPVLALDLNLTDMLFRYGVRINPALLADIQCLPIPVNVSSDPEQPNFQPLPWHYAPLLLTSQVSPITRNLGQVSSVFSSPIDIVGGDDHIRKTILLATSTATRLIPTPAQVNLDEINPDYSLFKYQHAPTAVALEGKFPSAFAHRMQPENIVCDYQRADTSRLARQIVVSSGSIIRNETEQGKALPVGYDRYSGMQFANRDFLINAVLYLTDSQGLIPLREKTIALRLLNDQRAYALRTPLQWYATLLPIAILALIGILFISIRKYRFIHKYPIQS